MRAARRFRMRRALARRRRRAARDALLERCGPCERGADGALAAPAVARRERVRARAGVLLFQRVPKAGSAHFQRLVEFFGVWHGFETADAYDRSGRLELASARRGPRSSAPRSPPRASAPRAPPRPLVVTAHTHFVAPAALAAAARGRCGAGACGAAIVTLVRHPLARRVSHHAYVRHKLGCGRGAILPGFGACAARSACAVARDERRGSSRGPAGRRSPPPPPPPGTARRATRAACSACPRTSRSSGCCAARPTTPRARPARARARTSARSTTRGTSTRSSD